MRSVFLALGLGLVSACSTANRDLPGQTTYGGLRKAIIIGESTQNDVIGLMGNPTRTMRNTNGFEVWTYAKQRYDADSGRTSKGVVLFGGGSAPNSSGILLCDLIFVFDRREVVKDYSIVSSDF